MLQIELGWPTNYRPPVVVHPYGERRPPPYPGGVHEGADIRAPLGYEILAATDGRVDIAAFGKTYGNQVWLSHDLEVDRIQTVYAHMDKIDPGISRGVYVKKGQRLGWAGSTGNSTAAHLHFGLRYNGKWIDPQPYLVTPKE